MNITDAAIEAAELLCPKCGHGIDSHGWDGDYAITCCLTCVNGSPRLKPGDFNLKLHPKPRKEVPNV